MAGKSKILVIGGTGYIGKFIVQASVAACHPTIVLVRESTFSDPAPPKANLLHSFRNSGVNFIFGDLYDHESLVRAIEQVDVVISAVGYAQLNDQDKILAAIRETGTAKRFFPSEFGNDVDRVHAVEPGKEMFMQKARFRRLVEASGVPYTYVSSNFFAGIYLKTLAQLDASTAPPRDKVVIFGDGNTKVVYNKEQDVATYTIKTVDDPLTLNKILYVRPPPNSISLNNLVTLWEHKCGIKLERIYIPEDQILKDIQGLPVQLKVRLAICHSVFVKGDQTNFEIEPSFGVEASELYPEVRFATVDEMLDQYV